MAETDINDLTSQLAKTTVDPNIILSFAGKGFKLDNEQDAADIVSAIDGCKKLITLDLQGNTLGVAAAKAIGKALEKHPEFENALWSDMFTGRMKTEIPEALKYLGAGVMKAGAKLKELNLSDNAFGPNGMKGLTELLTSESCFSLKVLRLHNNGLGTTGGKMLADSLSECQSRSVKAGRPLALRVFQSGRGRLENDGSIELAKAFKAMGSLEEVVMPQNGIYHPGITALSDAFMHSPHLKHINLQDNTFTERGALAMAKALPKLQELEIINFGDCLLKTKGALALAKGLQEGHPVLREVHLTFNEIGIDGAKEIANVLTKKVSLEKLELDGNCFGETGVEELQSIMKAAGKMDQLGSLSEDEGSEDEKEDDEDDDQDEVEHEQESKSEEKAVPKEEVKQNGVHEVVDKEDDNDQVQAGEVVACPSPNKLNRAGSQSVQIVLDHLGSAINDVDKAVNVMMQICAKLPPGEGKAKIQTCECADAIFSKLFSSTEENRAAAVCNAILVNLGLIKCEEKKFQPFNQLTGPLVILDHVVQQPYFPQVAKNILAVFLNRDHPKLESCKHQVDSLQKTLSSS